METKMRCHACGQTVTVGQGVCPGVWNVRPCKCMVKDSWRDNAQIWNDHLRALQGMYGSLAVPDECFRKSPIQEN